jgi:hypothetical protein
MAAIRKGRFEAGDMSEKVPFRIVEDRGEKRMTMDSVEICAGAGGPGDGWF